MGDLAQRCLRFGWRLVEEHGELVLRGNGADAAFISEASLRVWLDKQEKAERTDVEPEQLVMDFAA